MFGERSEIEDRRTAILLTNLRGRGRKPLLSQDNEDASNGGQQEPERSESHGRPIRAASETGGLKAKEAHPAQDGPHLHSSGVERLASVGRLSVHSGHPVQLEIHASRSSMKPVMRPSDPRRKT